MPTCVHVRARRWWRGWAKNPEAGCGIGLPDTPPPSSAVGWTKPKSRSACFPGNAWADAASETEALCSEQLGLGSGALIAIEFRLNGPLFSRKLVLPFPTQPPGHGTCDFANGSAFSKAARIRR